LSRYEYIRLLMNPLHVLISLHRGYGLGDGVQMSAVLRHVHKYRTNWIVDYLAEEGKHQVGRGLVRNTFSYTDPRPSTYYDAEVQICLYDTWANWSDRPNTRVSSCLHELFGLRWDPECGRYRVEVSQSRKNWAASVVPSSAVAVHSRGDSDKFRKDLTDIQTTEVSKYIRDLGRTPYLLGRHIPLGYDAEVNCAIISRCEAFVGIDSGPSKCASATDTPALVVWTGHHPAPFHDPAPNTTHLVPVGYHGLEPVCNDPGVIAWFESHYNVRQYERDPVDEIKKWLTEVLK
jgi:hypothetical protein